MFILDLLNERFSRAMKSVLPEDAAQPLVQVASRPEFGDYQANGIMPAAKRARRNPRQVAEEVIAALDLNGLAGALSVAGPGFINVKLDTQWVEQQARNAAADIARLAVPQARAEHVVVDYSSVNLAKEMHVGHLRSTIIGDALVRVHEFLGYRVTRQNHVGDWGTQFGMLIAHFVDVLGTQQGPSDLSDLEAFYRAAKARFDEDAAFADKCREYVVRLQAGDPDVKKAWEEFVAISLWHCHATYRLLGVKLVPEDVKGESAYNDDLGPIVEDLTRRGLAVESEGARVVPIGQAPGAGGKPPGGVFMVQKRDGGYLYGTTDLAAIRYRVRQLKASRILYVVDERQALHFEQLFHVARRAGYVPPEVELRHVAFGMVTDASGKPFKTRSGDTIKLAALLEEAQVRAAELINRRGDKAQVTDPKALAAAIGLGAVKYADLSKGRLSNYVFDWDSMLSFEGNTAPYLQYANVRALRIAERANGLPVHPASLVTDPERSLALHLIRFADTLRSVSDTLFPHLLCAYLFELASQFSKFYEDCPVIEGGHANEVRLCLVNLTARTMTSGLGLLGIPTVTEM